MLLALALLLAQAPAPDPDTPRLTAAAAALHAHQPQQALDLVAPVLDGYATRLSTEHRRVYCGMSTQETLLYLATAAKDKVPAVAISADYCTALYFRGFALVDLGRLAEGRASYQQLATLAPMHAHFAAELGQSYRPEKNWPAMLDRCTAAAGMTDLSPEAERRQEKLFAWHCMGYALSELGRFDEAEKLYKDCLALDPLDTHARNELTYIAQQRARRTQPAQ